MTETSHLTTTSLKKQMRGAVYIGYVAELPGANIPSARPLTEVRENLCSRGDPINPGSEPRAIRAHNSRPRSKVTPRTTRPCAPGITEGLEMSDGQTSSGPMSAVKFCTLNGSASHRLRGSWNLPNTLISMFPRHFHCAAVGGGAPGRAAVTEPRVFPPHILGVLDLRVQHALTRFPFDGRNTRASRKQVSKLGKLTRSSNRRQSF
jgi:hypothetical protein